MFRMKNKSISTMDKTKLLRNSGTYVVLAMALGAMTFFGVCDPGGGLMGPQGPAATIGDETISRSEFNRAYRLQYERFQRQYQDQFDPAALQLAKTVMDQLVDQRILYLKAEALGLKASDDEVTKVLADLEIFKDDSGNFSEEYFERFLKNQNFTEYSLQETIRRDATLNRLRQFITQNQFVSSKSAEFDYRLAETKLNLDYLKVDPSKVAVSIPEEEKNTFMGSEEGREKIKKYFETNKKEFNQEEQVKARHILVSFKGARNATGDGGKRIRKDCRERNGRGKRANQGG
jgi:peptidyl-prolyl cis-trans isomerase D